MNYFLVSLTDSPPSGGGKGDVSILDIILTIIPMILAVGVACSTLVLMWKGWKYSKDETDAAKKSIHNWFIGFGIMLMAGIIVLGVKAMIGSKFELPQADYSPIFSNFFYMFNIL